MSEFPISIEVKGDALDSLGSKKDRKAFNEEYDDGRIKRLVCVDYPELSELDGKAAFEVIHSIARLRTYIQGLEGLEKGVRSELAATVQNAFLRALFIRTELARLGFGEGIALRFMGLRPLEITDLRVISRVFFRNEEFLTRQSELVISSEKVYVSEQLLQSLAVGITEFSRSHQSFKPMDLFSVGLYDPNNAEREKLMVNLGLRVNELSNIVDIESNPIKNVVIIPILQAAYLLSTGNYDADSLLRLIKVQLNSRVLAAEPQRIIPIKEWGERRLGLGFFLKAGVYWFSDEQIMDIEAILGQNVEVLVTWLQGKTGEPTQRGES
jgi:hypothetical protein